MSWLWKGKREDAGPMVPDVPEVSPVDVTDASPAAEPEVSAGPVRGPGGRFARRSESPPAEGDASPAADGDAPAGDGGAA